VNRPQVSTIAAGEVALAVTAADADDPQVRILSSRVGSRIRLGTAIANRAFADNRNDTREP
jgi:hypothetical protein